ncbi:TPA: ead/Ea22-like family protein [Pseudomonas aeruginosa]
MSDRTLLELAARAACERWITDQKLCQGSDISLFRLERNGELVSLHALLCEAYQAGQVRAAANPKTVLALLDEIDGLRSRLEIDERTPHDGIACRDETIKVLDEKCDRLKAENEALRKFSAEAYQVLGALDAPENVLDNASDAANGVPLRHETLLPFFAEDYEALRKDAARYRWLIASAWYVGPDPEGDTEAVSWHDHNDTLHGVTTAIDAAIEGAKQ